MRDGFITLISAIALGVIAACFSQCKAIQHTVEKVNVDSIKQANDSLQNLLTINLKSYKLSEDSLNTTIDYLKYGLDSLQHHSDSIAEDLQVSNYKLGRIKYYNSITTGNNLSFLRGWINRVLKD